MCLQAFDSLDLRDVNLEILPCISVLLIVKDFIECSHYDKTKLWLDKIKFRLGGKVSIRHPYQCKIIGNLPKEIFLALGCKMFMITFPSLKKNKCYAISFTRMDAVVALFSVLSGMPEGTVILQEESVEWKS